MKTEHIGISLTSYNLIDACLESLMKSSRPKGGLPAHISSYRRANDGTRWFGHRIHYWITVADRTIGLRIAEHRSRPRRRVLNELMTANQPPTLVIYAKMKFMTIVHNLAKCIKVGLSRMRKGLIECVREAVRDGRVPRCDNGNFMGRIPSQFELSALQANAV